MEAGQDKDDDSSSNEELFLRFAKNLITVLDQETLSELPKAIHMYNRFQCVLCIGKDPTRLRFLSYLLSQHFVMTRKDQDVHLLRYVDNSNLIDPESAFRLLSKYNFRDAHFLKCLKIFKLPTHDALLEHLLSFNIGNNHLSPGTIIVDNLTNWIQPVPPNESDEASKDTRSDTQNFVDENPVEIKLRFVHLTCAALREAISYCGRIYSGEKVPIHCRTPGYSQPVSKKALLIVTLDLNHFFSTLYPDGLQPGKKAEAEREHIITELADEFFERCIDVDKI